MSLPFIGSKIQIISKSDIRFIGILNSINEKESSISLEQVQSFGTEGRTGDPTREILPMPQLFPLIVFKGSDVKDLSVITAPAAYNMPPPMNQGMPQMNQGMPQMNQGMPQMNQGMPQMNHGVPQMNQGMPQMNQGMPQMNQNMASMNIMSQGMPPMPAVNPGMRTQPGMAKAAAMSHSIPSVMMPPGFQSVPNTVPPSYWQPEPLLNQSIQNLSMEKEDISIAPKRLDDDEVRKRKDDKSASRNKNYQEKKNLRKEKDSRTVDSSEKESKDDLENHRGEETRQERRQNDDGKHRQQDKQNNRDKKPVEKSQRSDKKQATELKNDQEKPARRSDQTKPERRTEQAMPEKKIEQDQANRKPDQRQAKPKMVVPDTEFDFETANAKFSRNAASQDNDEKQPEQEDFYQKSSFFDNISSDIKDKEQGIDRKALGQAERSKNMETFGQSGIRRNNRGRGRGRGRGRPSNQAEVKG